MPETGTVWGLLGAVSETTTEAERLPDAAGLKVTLIEHLAPAAMLVPQLLVCEKSLEFVPDTATLVMLKLPLPVFDRVIA